MVNDTCETMSEQVQRPRKRRRVGSATPSHSQDDSSKQRNRSGNVTATGSYNKYYSRRVGDKNAEDSRLSLLREDWIRGKEVLDIGCNEGTFTLEFAKRFGPKRVVGIDIDGKLLKKARYNLRKQAAQERPTLSSTEKNGFIPISCVVVQGGIDQVASVPKSAETEQESKKDGCAGDIISASYEFPFNVSFRKEDVTAEDAGIIQEVGSYDVVLCMSITKWIHMAGGDTALKRVFKLILQCLKPGGVFILEPQPEKSYKRARSKGIKQAPGVKLKPENFCSYLVEKGGFASYETLQERKEKGTPFNRPVYAIFKAGNNGDQQAPSSNETSHSSS